MEPYEFFEHTADIGLRARGRDFQDLLLNAAAGLLDLVTDRKRALRETDALLIGFTLKAENAEELLMKWMREILFNFSAKRFMLTEFRFESLSETHLDVRAKAVPFDPDKHEQKHEVKAVTYHGYKLEHKPDGWLAEIVLDI